MEKDRNIYLIKDYDEHIDILHRVLDNFLYVSSNYADDNDCEKVISGIENLIKHVNNRKKRTIENLSKYLNSLKEREVKLKKDISVPDISSKYKGDLESYLKSTQNSIEFCEKELKCLKKLKKIKTDNKEVTYMEWLSKFKKDKIKNKLENNIWKTKKRK